MANRTSSGEARQEPKAGTEVQTTGEGYVLACSVALLIQSRPTSLRVESSTMDWAFLHHSVIKKRPPNMPTHQSGGGNSSVKIPRIFRPVKAGRT